MGMRVCCVWMEIKYLYLTLCVTYSSSRKINLLTAWVQICWITVDNNNSWHISETLECYLRLEPAGERTRMGWKNQDKRRLRDSDTVRHCHTARLILCIECKDQQWRNTREAWHDIYSNKVADHIFDCKCSGDMELLSGLDWDRVRSMFNLFVCRYSDWFDINNTSDCINIFTSQSSSKYVLPRMTGLDQFTPNQK